MYGSFTGVQRECSKNFLRLQEAMDFATKKKTLLSPSEAYFSEVLLVTACSSAKARSVTCMYRAMEIQLRPRAVLVT